MPGQPIHPVDIPIQTKIQVTSTTPHIKLLTHQQWTWVCITMSRVRFVLPFCRTIPPHQPAWVREEPPGRAVGNALVWKDEGTKLTPDGYQLNASKMDAKPPRDHLPWHYYPSNHTTPLVPIPQFFPKRIKNASSAAILGLPRLHWPRTSLAGSYSCTRTNTHTHTRTHTYTHNTNNTLCRANNPSTAKTSYLR